MYIPVWPSRWVLPVSGGLMLLYLVLRVIRDIARAHDPEKCEAVFGKDHAQS